MSKVPARCPAQQANGVNTLDSTFRLRVEECAGQSEVFGVVTEVFGFFHQQGDALDDEECLNDALVTAIAHVPAASVIACMAHQVKPDFTWVSIGKVEDFLRDKILQCQCTDQKECPALNESSLFLALERAIA